VTTFRSGCDRRGESLSGGLRITSIVKELRLSGRAVTCRALGTSCYSHCLTRGLGAENNAVLSGCHA